MVFGSVLVSFLGCFDDLTLFIYLFAVCRHMYGLHLCVWIRMSTRQACMWRSGDRLWSHSSSLPLLVAGLFAI